MYGVPDEAAKIDTALPVVSDDAVHTRFATFAVVVPARVTFETATNAEPSYARRLENSTEVGATRISTGISIFRLAFVALST
jgi:hypothetical protein